MKNRMELGALVMRNKRQFEETKPYCLLSVAVLQERNANRESMLLCSVLQAVAGMNQSR